VSRDEIEEAARAAGADGPISRLPGGYDTVLGTWFEGGTDLSVGEWQRIALARAFLRQAPVVVLDEPTSAMDSWAEADWLARFRTLVAGRTAILITHRFTTARYADVIHVMEGGQIVESGSHEELVASGGRYAQSWNAQTAGVVCP
jgi:ATP-binding cassette subfamily B protein